MPLVQKLEKPAELDFKSEGSYFVKSFRSDGTLHRVCWYMDTRLDANAIHLSELIKRGYHRPDGPALIIYYPDGSVCTEEWWFEGTRHRDICDGPSFVVYFENGSVEEEEFWVEGSRASELEVISACAHLGRILPNENWRRGYD